MANPTKEELQQAVREAIGSDIITTIGYLEHQMDLQGKLIEMLISKLEATGTTFTSDEQSLINDHQGIMQYTSVDFANLTDPFQSYKIPSATQAKQRIRQLQQLYLTRLQELGLL